MTSRMIAVGSGAAAAGLAVVAVLAWTFLFHGKLALPSFGGGQTQSSAPPAGAAPAPLANVPATVPPAAAPPSAAAALPQFDVVRVEPSGDAVIAGRAAPNSTVALTVDGKVVAEAKVDANGNFVLVPILPPGAYELGLRMTSPGEAAVASTQSVTVSVPAKGSGQGVMVALNEAGKPTRLLADPTAPAAGAVTVPPAVAVKTAEVQEGGGFLASGTAAPGAHVRVYLNDSPLADVTAAPDGTWSVTVGKGMTPGHYTVRADSVDPGGKVVARAEVPFEAPAMPAAGGKTGAASATPQPSAAVVHEIQTATVQPGDSLWVISRKVFGDGLRYTQLYAANSTQIRNPDLIYPGQIFVVPGQKP